MTKPKKDTAPNDDTSYTLIYTTPTFTGSETLDTPSAVRDRLDELHAKHRISTFTVRRGEEDDITLEFQ